MSQAEQIPPATDSVKPAPGPVKLVPIDRDQINQVGAASNLTRVVDELSEGGKAETLSLDLAEVEKLGSIGLNHLIQINRHARMRGLTVELKNVRPFVNEVLELTRLERLFRRNAPAAESDAAASDQERTETTGPDLVL